ncbi:MAG TPA: hypothetical protein VFW05_00040 [Verrucomicrobiae bacterium]|nr:hypothetical protein [Verrucomicrobiae bacterium]
MKRNDSTQVRGSAAAPAAVRRALAPNAAARFNTKRFVGLTPQRSAARARLIAPGAGALPISAESFRMKRDELTEGERSRLGCSSARLAPNTAARFNTKRFVDFMPQRSAARAQLIAPGAGALPISAESFRMKWNELTEGERSRLGCSSARLAPNTAARFNTKRFVDFTPQRSAARARLIAPGAGALPGSTASV